MDTGNATRKVALACLAVLSLIVGLAVTAGAQAPTGQIVGTAFDTSGGVVPNVKVSLAQKATGLTREQVTSAEGQFRFVLLPVGLYSLTFTHPSFKTYKVDVEVTVGAVFTVNATLSPGVVTQVIEVKATPLIETTQANADALIGVRPIEELPINGRRFQDFVTLTPTVQIEPQRSGISFAGQRGINAEVTIDGADYTEPFFGGIRGGERANFAFTIPQEAISQFQVVANGYSVEYGRSTGGLLKATTKSGTNQIHGSAFFFARNSALARNDAFNREAITNLYQEGGSFGGPIKKDKLFYFAAFEYQRNNNPGLVAFPTIDVLTPASSQLEAFNFFRSQEVPFTITNNAPTGLGRLDFQPSSNHHIYVTYHYSKDTGENAVSTGSAISTQTTSALSNNGNEGDRTNSVVGHWTAILSPTLVLDTGGEYSLENRPRLANSRLAGVSFSPIGAFGTKNFLPTTLDDYRVQLFSNLSWTHGTHQFKFGGEYDFIHINQLFAFNQFGTFSISPVTDPTNPLANTPTAVTLDILSVGSGGAGDPVHRLDTNGAPAGTRVTYAINIGNGLLDTQTHQIAFFAEDTWRITPRFTLTAGLRWEGYVNPQPATSNTSLYNTVKNFPFPIGLTVDPARIPNNLNQFMPRLGLAWDPTGHAKTVFRANAGIFYATTPLLLYAAPLNNFRVPPGDLSVVLPLALPSGFTCTPLFTGDTCNTVYDQMRRIGIDMDTLGFNNLPTITPDQITQIATALGIPAPNPFQGASPITMANDYESPRSWQWDVGMEHEIAPGWSLGADFLYVNTVHLEQDRNLNLPAPLVCAGTPLPPGCTKADLSLRPCVGVRGGACSQARPIPTLGDITIRQSNVRSLYRGLTLRTNLNRRHAQFQAYYTFSYNYSGEDNERLAVGYNYDNAFNLAPEYGFSALDARHLFVASGLVDLPLGFTLSALGRLRSGRPIDALVGSDVNGDGNIFGDRAFRAPGVSFRRNAFRDRSSQDVDLRLAKKFRLPREGMQLLFTADFFNLFNFDNVSFLSTTPSPFNPLDRYGVGVNASGSITPPNASFQQLTAPQFCSSNPGCYNKNATPGSPFTVQLGVRFDF